MNIEKLKYLAIIKKGKNPPEEDCSDTGVPYLSMDYLRDLSAPTRYLRRNDSVVAKDGQILLLWDGSNAGEFIKSKAGLVSSTTALIEAKKHACNNYLWFCLKSIEADLKSQTIGMGIPHVDGSCLRNILIQLPSLLMQRQIAAYLNRETTKIDRLIAKQKRLIELLQEKRQAVISGAVTEGLNPNAKMKDSGVEWLGEVPEDWQIIQLRRITKEHRQGYYSPEAYVDDGIPLARITDITEDCSLDLSSSPRVEFTNNLKEFYLSPGDILFARTGGAGSHALVTNLSEPSVYASYLIRFRFSETVSPEFISYFFSSTIFFNQIEGNIHGGVNKNIHAEDIKNAWLPLPPLETQLQIVNNLDTMSIQLKALVAKSNLSVTLLKEHRQALISAAVTGKIDVRGLVTDEEVAALDAEPEEMPELETEDASYISEEEQG